MDSPFDAALRRGDLELMLKMAAKPGTQWTQRFLLSRNQIVAVPCEGRESIPLVTSPLFGGRSDLASIEGLEIMMMYGYELKDGDFDLLFPHAIYRQRHMKLLKLALAVSALGSGEWKLQQAIDAYLGALLPWDMRWNQTSTLDTLELVRILLKSGVNPNFLVDGESTMLSLSLHYRDKQMATLLVSFGADSSLLWRSGAAGDEEEVSIRDKAEELGMSDLLIPPERLEMADPAACIADLRKELEAPIRELVPDYSSILVVAVMRNTGCAPPLGLMSKLVLEYSPLGFDFWKMETV